MDAKIAEAMKKDNLPNLNLNSNDMRSTKAAFVKAYVALLSQDENNVQTKKEKYDAGVQAWMSSEIRACLNSGKAKSFALVSS